VLAAEAGHEYVGQDGIRIPARAAGNPYGNVYLDLGNGVCIHGSSETIPSQASLGCLSLSDADVADIAGILSLGSKVTIR
jgi:lipoprotein-anchoring transpeptidase ErfK/SrfK